MIAASAEPAELLPHAAPARTTHHTLMEIQFYVCTRSQASSADCTVFVQTVHAMASICMHNRQGLQETASPEHKLDMYLEVNADPLVHFVTL